MSTFSKTTFAEQAGYNGNTFPVYPEVGITFLNGLQDQVLANLANIVPPAGTNYYVEANVGDDSNDGLSWDNAFKTLSTAFVASNANIALAAGTGWAARNRIYYKGDNKEAAAEDLITLPSKCDVIGVGSYDHKDHPSLIGNHVVGAAAYMGTRFFNMGFQSPAAGGALFTVPTTTSGLRFFGCTFDGRSATPATIGLSITAVEECEIVGCEFRGLFSTAAISLGAGSSRGLRIVDNEIESGAIGILVNSSLTCVADIAKILRNVFSVVTLVVDDNSSKCLIGDNRGKTEAAKEIATVLDVGDYMGYNNMFANAAGWGVYPVVAAIS